MPAFSRAAPDGVSFPFSVRTQSAVRACHQNAAFVLPGLGKLRNEPNLSGKRRSYVPFAKQTQFVQRGNSQSR
jgi:hypothetical protein